MAKKSNNQNEEVSALSFEDALGQLEAMVARIESGEIGLEKSLETYEQGMALVKRCRAILQHTEQRVEILKAEAHADTPDGPGDASSLPNGSGRDESSPPPLRGEDVPF